LGQFKDFYAAILVYLLGLKYMYSELS